MKRKFALEPVVRIRQLQEREAAGAHAAAMGEVQAAEDRADYLKRSLGSMPVPQNGPAAVLQAAARFREVTSMALAETHARTEELSAVAEVTRMEWAEAAQASKVMEKLRDRHVAAVNSADQHAEVIQVDDLVAARFAGRRKN